MPWKVNSAMDERMQFVADCLAQEEAMAELCRRYGISRKSGYKWLARYREGGARALLERSRAPLTHPNALEPGMKALLLGVRAKHATWGPRKLLAWLARHHAEVPVWPAASTVGDLLRRQGLVIQRPRRRQATPSTSPLSRGAAPNELWCADFKGWFATADGQHCTPLTITDGATRFLLRCQGLGRRTDRGLVQPLFEAAFREYGLPLAMRTDNGPPFASCGLAGLSRLSVWWIRLGIRPERIAPGHPEQNGAHERMHRTLKAETTRPAAANLRAQQRLLDRFREQFNGERPHEALGQHPPADFYTRSPRLYPARLAPIEYHDDWEVRAVRGSGQIKWGGQDVRVTQALRGERVGLKPVQDGIWKVYFANVALGIFDERKGRVRKLKPGD